MNELFAGFFYLIIEHTVGHGLKLKFNGISIISQKTVCLHDGFFYSVWRKLNTGKAFNNLLTSRRRIFLVFGLFVFIMNM